MYALSRSLFLPSCRLSRRLSAPSPFSTSSTVMKAKMDRKKNSLLSKFYQGQNKKKSKKVIESWNSMSVSDLSKQLSASVDDVFEVVLSIPAADFIQDENQPINDQMVFNEICKKLDIKMKKIPNPNAPLKAEERKNLDFVRQPPPQDKDLISRPPCVAIMGHIDHGKTTLLDHLRKSQIVDKEFGGITQHIGAFSVTLDAKESDSSHNKVTFLDTPGHAAFKAMRSRGASTTDIVVLVVDSCEGVLEQTLESLRMIRQARTPLVIAMNKIDKPKSDVENTKKQLYDAGVELEDYGGDVQAIPISALNGTNVNHLIEALLIQAELLQLKCDMKGFVEGMVIESQVEKGLGKSATILVQRGVLKKGDILISGKSMCKIKTLINDLGKQVKELKPSEAAKVVGWKNLPRAGNEVFQVESERRANEIIKWREQEELNLKAQDDLEVIEQQRKMHHEQYTNYRIQKLSQGVMKPRFGRYDFHVRQKESVKESDKPKVSVLVKADVDGSLEAILNILDTYNVEDEVILDIVNFGVGDVTESDIELAKTFDGIIYAFNVGVNDAMKKKGREGDVRIREYNIIYRLIDDLKEEISAKLPMQEVEEILGQGIVQQEFLINVGKKKIPVAGCRVNQGKFLKDKYFKVTRGRMEACERTELLSLKHLKDEVSEISQGKECGLRIQNEEFRFEDGDIITCFDTRTEIKRTEWDPGF